MTTTKIAAAIVTAMRITIDSEYVGADTNKDDENNNENSNENNNE